MPSSKQAEPARRAGPDRDPRPRQARRREVSDGRAVRRRPARCQGRASTTSSTSPARSSRNDPRACGGGSRALSPWARRWRLGSLELMRLQIAIEFRNRQSLRQYLARVSMLAPLTTTAARARVERHASCCHRGHRRNACALRDQVIFGDQAAQALRQVVFRSPSRPRRPGPGCSPTSASRGSTLPLRPSASVLPTVMGTMRPAARAAVKAHDCAASTPTTRIAGVAALAKRAMPLTRPPPPMATTIVSTSGQTVANLQCDRAAAGNHVLVAVGRDEDRAGCRGRTPSPSVRRPRSRRRSIAVRRRGCEWVRAWPAEPLRA